MIEHTVERARGVIFVSLALRSCLMSSPYVSCLVSPVLPPMNGLVAKLRGSSAARRGVDTPQSGLGYLLRCLPGDQQAATQGKNTRIDINLSAHIANCVSTFRSPVYAGGVAKT